jgi:hypothetical protein
MGATSITPVQIPGAPSWLSVGVADGDPRRRGVAADALGDLAGALLRGREMARDASGRPVVRGGGVHVSLSHSAGVSVLAVAPCSVGVDIERIETGVDAAMFDAEVVGRHDLQLLQACECGEDGAAFYRLWTLKEAHLKERGLTLATSELPSILRDQCDARDLLTTGRVGCHMATRLISLCGHIYCVGVCWASTPAAHPHLRAAA